MIPKNNEYDYKMSEQASLDLWCQFGSPPEIHGSKESYKKLISWNDM